MDRLERYLDEICRSVGGPRSLRQHLRRELREHLRDAVAGHRAAGLSEEDALERALADFGGPEEVRSELEATHGQRLIAVVIDKAMQWKETTMKAKWLWSSWAHLALAGVIVMEVLFITFTVIFIIPKFQQLLREGLIDPDIIHESGTSWLPAFLDRLNIVGGGYTTWLLLGSVAAWGLFEWRVRSENKPMIRLSFLGTAAMALTVVGALTGAALAICFTLGFPAAGRLAQSYALDQVSAADASISALEQAMAKKDWGPMQDQAERARRAIDNLQTKLPAVPALVRRHAPPTVASAERAINGLRAGLETANADLVDAQHAIREKDAAGLESAMQKFRKSYETVRETAKKPKG